MGGARCLEVAPSPLRDSTAQGASEGADLLASVLPLAASALRGYPGSFCFVLRSLRCHFHQACVEGGLLASATYLRHRVTVGSWYCPAKHHRHAEGQPRHSAEEGRQARMLLRHLCLSRTHDSKIRIKPMSERCKGSFTLIPSAEEQN